MHYTNTTLRHVRKVLPDLRDVDRLEARLTTGTPIEVGLVNTALRSAEVFTIKHGTRVLGLFGHVAHGDTGIPWLVGTDELTDRWVEFSRASIDLFRRIASQYETLTNVLIESNTLHRRWLEWLGCEFSHPFSLPGTPQKGVRFTYVCSRRPRDARSERR